MGLATYINSTTGDYEIENGVIQIKNALLSEAYMRLACPLGKYINDPTFGSELSTLFNSRASITKNQFIQMISRALQPMVESAKITSLRVDILSAIFGRYVAEVYMVDHSGELINFTWESLLS